jgi:hypothetical protein
MPSGFGQHGHDAKERPFALGEYYGVRAFRVSRSSSLTGVNYTEPYDSAITYARCLTAGHLSTYTPHMFCACGIYGFWGSGLFGPMNKSEHFSYMNYNTVIGVVAGFGRTVYSDQGFRCEKARIVAIVNPYLGKKDRPRRSLWRRTRRWFTSPGIPNIQVMLGVLVVYMAAMLANIVFGIFDVYSAEISTGITWGGAGLLIGFSIFNASRQILKNRLVVDDMHAKTDLTPKDFELIKVRYPKVKQYRTYEDMLEAHPVTPYRHIR